jgi:uncharacterized protein (DUF983 family)
MVVRSEILCPNCFKGKLLKDKNDNQVWCDRCGQEYEEVGENTVKFK